MSIDGKEKVQKNTQLSSFWCQDFIFVAGSATTSFGTTLEFAAFRSSPDAKYSRTSAFLFFVSTTDGFCGGPNTFSQKNTRLYFNRPSCDQLTAVSVKMNISFANIAGWSTGQRDPRALQWQQWVRIPEEQKCFFQYCSFSLFFGNYYKNE